MTKAIFRNIITPLFVCFFVIVSISPIIESITLKRPDERDATNFLVPHGINSISDVNMCRGGCEKLVSNTRRSGEISRRPGVPTSRGYFYAYNAYDPTGQHAKGPITFDTPDTIELLLAGTAPNFIGGGDIDADGNWYGVDYGGGIYKTNFDGTMTYMGPSPSMNGLCFDSTTATWYGSGDGSLYTVDVLTGSSTVVGSHGITNTLIGIICDNNGDIYGYDMSNKANFISKINKRDPLCFVLVYNDKIIVATAISMGIH